jgi:cbb3-type cytochrome oxidase subunit 3
MRMIRGTSDWRDFVLPAYLMGHRVESVTLEINIVMPGKGTIELKELTVNDLQTFATGTWWLILSGVVFVVIVFFVFRRIQRQRAQAEQRKMQALDA